MKHQALTNRIASGIVICSALTGLSSCKESIVKEEKSKPNIIFILADDLGYGDIGSFGQQTLSTPHIDQLAAEGMIMTRHYAGSTVCGPSRAALLTGKHTGNTSVRGNQPPQLLDDQEITLSSVLKDAGYVTGKIGKWGLGHPPPVDDPEKKGFDFFYGYINMWHAHNYYPEFLYRNGQKEYLEGNKLMKIDGKNPFSTFPEGTGVAEKREQYSHFMFDEESVRFIEANKDTTFFLFMSLLLPHTNNEAGTLLGDGMEVPDYGEFEDENWPNPKKGFARMVQYLDNTVGMINAKLVELGIDENTIIIFTSDNGPHNEGGHSADSFNSRGGLRGSKRDLYEGGIRVPTIIKWEGKIESGSKTDHISAFWDYLPMFAEIGNVPIDNSQFDGISFLPTLLGKPNQQKKHDYLYWEFYEGGGKQAILMNNWKGIRFETRSGQPTPVMLYNLENDPSEENNVADQNPEIVEEILKYMDEAHTPLPAISLFNKNVSSEMQF